MINKINKIFNAEFGVIKEKFIFLDMKIEEAKESKQDFIWHPGVYIFYTKNEIIKVGRHLENSRKRALEHINEGTKNSNFNMKVDFKQEKDSLLLINCIRKEDSHWVAAIEIYLEEQLNPKIKSKRKG